MNHPAAEFRLKGHPLAAFTGGAMVLLILAALTWNFSLKAAEATRFVVHTHEVLASLQRLNGFLARAESEQRGYLISGDTSQLQRSRQAMAAVNTELDRLTIQLADSALQSERLRVLRASCERRVALLEHNIALDDALPGVRSGVNVADGVEVDRQISAQLADMNMEEQRLLKQRQQIENDRAYVSAFGFIALVVVLVIALPLLYLRLRQSERINKDAAGGQGVLFESRRARRLAAWRPASPHRYARDGLSAVGAGYRHAHRHTGCDRSRKLDRRDRDDEPGRP